MDWKKKRTFAHFASFRIKHTVYRCMYLWSSDFSCFSRCRIATLWLTRQVFAWPMPIWVYVSVPTVLTLLLINHHGRAKSHAYFWSHVEIQPQSTRRKASSLGWWCRKHFPESVAELSSSHLYEPALGKSFHVTKQFLLTWPSIALQGTPISIHERHAAYRPETLYSQAQLGRGSIQFRIWVWQD